METEVKGNKGVRLVDWGISLALAGLALGLYLLTMADYVYPGEGAHLMSVWSGLSTPAYEAYPLMGWFARIFGAGNGFSALCGAVSVLALYHLASVFTRLRATGEDTAAHAVSASRLGASVVAVVFMCTPAVQRAATHLEPNMFAVTWALLALAAMLPCARLGAAVAWVFPVLSGVMVGLGAVDTSLHLMLLPLYLLALWTLGLRAQNHTSYARAVGYAWLFVLAAIAAFFVFEACAVGDLRQGWGPEAMCVIKSYFSGNWITVLVFATVPFVVTLFSSRGAFGGQTGWMSWLFHLAMTFAVILGASALSPSVVMADTGAHPVVTSAFVAFAAGYLAVYWWLQARAAGRVNESLQSTDPKTRLGRTIALVAGGVFAVAIGFTAILDVASFDRNAGRFADMAADRILDDLGERTWLVTSRLVATNPGSEAQRRREARCYDFDDHLRLAAARRPDRRLRIVSLHSETDKAFLARLATLISEDNLGGSPEANRTLCASLSLGVLPFVQDWFAADPAAAAEKAAVLVAADLWYGARKGDVQLRPVPEFLFFGGDPRRVCADADWESAWQALEEDLSADRKGAQKTWGSHLFEEKVGDPVERMRLSLRRHVGMVANNRGVWFADEKQPERAFAAFETVMNKVDADNVCALFNEIDLAAAGVAPAAAKNAELERRIKAIIEDKSRRYRSAALSLVYGYIRNWRVIVQLGCDWARWGRPGEALEKFRRVSDYIPTESRTAFNNMMAMLYASANDERKSKELYEQVLSTDKDNFDALLGLMRLALLEGDKEKAVEYLQRATDAAGDDPRANVELALLHLMRNELAKAKAILRKTTDADRGNLRAWSLLAAVTMQQIDASSDAAEKAAMTTDLEANILRTMETQAGPTDYYVQTVRAFILLRKGDEQRKAARDALAAASRERPAEEFVSDMVLELDISLNDTTDAERQARDVLRRNRKAPLANYVMGSLALQRGEDAEAEVFLRRSVESPRATALALNDLAEVLRRTAKGRDAAALSRLAEAQGFAERAVEKAPGLYVAWETLGAILLARNEDLDRAQQCVEKALELSRGPDGKERDVRMLITLARVQLARGDAARGKGTLRKVSSRLGELSDYEKEEFEELRKSAK